jgi:hypothetical protein
MAYGILFLAVALGSDQGGSDQGGSTLKSSDVATTGSQQAAASERGFHEFHQQITDLLKRESQTKDLAARAAAVREMCAVHAEIVHDSRYSNSEVLKEYRGRLWSRLTKVKAELKQQLARNKSNKESLENLAALESADSASVAAAENLATSLSLLDQVQSGPGQLMAFGGAPGAPDWGPDLVALIERTINPSFWDTVGGPGSIYYYRPLLCLVVRATSEVHEQIGGVIGGLRK